MTKIAPAIFYPILFLISILFSFSDVAHADETFADNKQYHQGFYNFYFAQESGKVYLEIKDFEQPFIFQSSMPHGIGSNDIGLDRGQLGNTRLVQFERIGNKVLLRQLNTYYRADSDNALERKAIDEAFASSIIWGFKLDEKALKEDKLVVDYTDFLLSDIHNIGDRLKRTKQGSFSVDKSRSGVYAKRTKAFVDNTEFEAVVTFKGSGAGNYLRSVTPENSAVTVNLHHSFIRLPDDGYQPREFHPFSGFFPIEYADYAAAIEEPMVKKLIPRHRLEKKDPKALVSEAVEPIVYYLDPGVPEPVRSALLDGARWWEQAFEAIGFKDAFQVKMLPADADPMDVRYNVIQWVHRATRGWSYGASVVDPRTGEILKGHVTLGSLRVRQDYLIALGLTSPFSSDNPDTTAAKEMALARIRQLSAHEVGHTLGIAHNFAASVKNRASVMDYPHPLVRLDKHGEVDLSDAYGIAIGDWDKYVVAYGYGDYSAETEAATLSELVQKVRTQGFQFISDRDARARSGAHADAHLWDNGANASEELARVLKVRAKALSDFGVNSVPKDTPLSELEQTLVPIYNFHRYQVEAAVKLIAGVHYDYSIKGQTSTQSVMVNVSPEQQQQTLSLLLSTLSSETLAIPNHIVKLIPPKAYGYSRDRESFDAKTGLTFDPVTAAEASAKHTISLLLHPERLARLTQQAALNPAQFDSYQLLAQLLASTIQAPDSSVNNASNTSGLNLLIQKRVNQLVLTELLSLWQQPTLVAEVRADLYRLLTELESWLGDHTGLFASDSPFYSQYLLFKHQLAFNWDKNQLNVPKTEVKLPPGSPIGSHPSH